jgi:hypothetical protein
MSAEQVDCVKRHLAMVFVHEIDPSFPPEQQEDLGAAHGAKAEPKNNAPPIGGHGPDGVILRC